MHHFQRRHFFALVIGLYFTLSTHAEAGFIVAEAELISPHSLINLEPASSTGTQHQKPTVAHYPWDGELTAFPTSGMSAPTSVTSPSAGSGLATHSTSEINISTFLISRLGPEGRVWLPPPFSTGIFRPPRFV